MQEIGISFSFLHPAWRCWNGGWGSLLGVGMCPSSSRGSWALRAADSRVTLGFHWEACVGGVFLGSWGSCREAFWEVRRGDGRSSSPAGGW